MKKILLIIIILFPTIVLANETENQNCKITVNDKIYSKLEDNNYSTYLNFTHNDHIMINCDETINNIYIMYNVKSTTGILNNTQKIGSNHYLNELIRLNTASNEIKLEYDDNYSIAEIYLFKENIPDWVQDWKTLKKADLMLFSTHSDDEQLFFSGLMPTYINKGYKIQVVYFTNHYNNTLRYHEQLDGLWTIGVEYYPIISTFPDAYSESLEGALKNLQAAGYTREDALAFEVNQIRKYQPYVVVGHDEKGEYSHGQHILNTDILKEAIIKAQDESYKTDLNLKIWRIQKLYLHLHDKNKIILNYDIPLEYYDGKTAYEVSKDGYAKHYSQQYTWFTEWLKGPHNSYKKATQIKTYNPAYYGLYYSSVGEDTTKDDMFENINFKFNEIIFNSNKNNININLIDNFKKLNSKTKLMYTGLTLLFISLIGGIVIHNKKRR